MRAVPLASLALFVLVAPSFLGIAPDAEAALATTDYTLTDRPNGWEREPASFTPASGLVVLPFSFPFYASTFTSVRFEEDGLLRFDEGTSTRWEEMTAIAPAFRPSFVAESRSIAIGPHQSWITFRWEVSQPTGNSVVLGRAHFEATLYVDGRIRFDYGADTIENQDSTIIGVRDGATFSRIVESGPIASLDFRGSHVLTPPFQDGIAKPNFVSPLPGRVYSGGVQVRTFAGSHAAVAGAITISASATMPLSQKVPLLELFIGTDKVASVTNQNSISYHWTPDVPGWHTYVVRVVATDASGQTQRFLDVFASPGPLECGTQVVVLSPNGGERIGSEWDDVRLAVFSVLDDVNIAGWLSRDGGATFPVELFSLERDGPFVGEIRVPSFTLNIVDTYEAILEASLGQGMLCSGTDRSDAIFTVDTNGLAVRLEAPPSGLTNGYYTSPPQLNVESWQEHVGQSWVEVRIDQGAYERVVDHLQEFENAAFTVDAVPIYLRDPQVDTQNKIQGLSSLRFDFNVRSDAERAFAMISRDLEYPVVLASPTGGAAFNTIELSTQTLKDPCLAFAGDFAIHLRDASGALIQEISANGEPTWVRHVWPTSATGTVSRIEIRMNVPIEGYVCEGAPPVLPITWRFDDLRVVNYPKLAVAVEGKAVGVDARVHGHAYGAGSGLFEDAVTKRLKIDLNPPTGSVAINGGERVTNTNVVSLTLSAADAVSAVTHMQVSNVQNDPDAPFVPFQSSLPWTLEPLAPGQVDAARRVYVKFRDAAGHVSAPPAQADIILDVQGPSNWRDYAPGEVAWQTNRTPQVEINVSDNVELDLTFVSAEFCKGPCFSATGTMTGTAKEGRVVVVAPALPSDGDWGVRFTARDAAGNAVTYPPVGQIPLKLRVDATPPTLDVKFEGGVMVNGKRFYGAPAVTLNLNAADAPGGSGVGSFALVNGGACAFTGTEWTSYAGNGGTPWTLAAGPDGARTVCARVRDAAGLVSGTDTDTAYVDRLPPLVEPASPAHGATGVDPLAPGFKIRGSWKDDDGETSVVSGLVTGSASIILQDLVSGGDVNLTASCEKGPTGFECFPAGMTYGRAYRVVVTLADAVGNRNAPPTWTFTTRPAI